MLNIEPQFKIQDSLFDILRFTIRKFHGASPSSVAIRPF